MILPEYPKIPGPFKRHTEGPDRNKVMEGSWTSPELAFLADLPWSWTEKVNGTNIRVHWDGHGVEFGGRTNNAQIPATLFKHLTTTFTEELFEQEFQEQPVTLYGEGYGAKIQQGGGNYRPDQSFVLFDVKIGNFWLDRLNVDDVARKLGIESVPEYTVGSIHRAIAAVKLGLVSEWGDFRAEGLVGVPVIGLLARDGKRIQVKIKSDDFFQVG
jgi:hypothetical protein